MSGAVTLDATVGAIVDSLPTAARIFSTLAINYCCGNNRTLGEASRQAAVRGEEVLDLLSGRVPVATDSGATDWSSASLTALADHLVTHHHVRARRDLVNLLLLGNEVASGHAASEPELWRLCDELEQLSRDLVPHMRREELYLFPYIRSMESPTGADQTLVVPLFGRIEYPLQAIKHDHSEDLSHLGRIRQIANSIRRHRCGRVQTLCELVDAFEFELQEHIRLENDILFPKAIEAERRSGAAHVK